MSMWRQGIKVIECFPTRQDKIQWTYYSEFLEWKFLLSRSTLNTELKGHLSEGRENQKHGEIHLIIWNFIYILVFSNVQLQILKII